VAVLTGHKILKEMEIGNIIITPFNRSHIGPNSYDCCLAPTLYIYYPGRILDLLVDDEPDEVVEMTSSGYTVRPGFFYLGKTLEWTETYNLVPYIDGRSSVGRKGLRIHETAGRGDNGFKGNWTLELDCVVPVRIYPNIRIAQLTYHTKEGENLFYEGRYQNSTEIVTSRLWKG